MKRKNPLVSSTRAKSNRRRRTKPSKTLIYSNIPILATSKTRNRRSSAGRGVILLNLSRLLVPLLVLISTTRCATTTSLSPLGLYKVGIGATNLVENILNTKNKAAALETTESITTTERVNTLVDKHGSSTRNNNDHSKLKKKKKNTVTNKKRRRDRNKNSIKRSNSDIKKKKTQTNVQTTNTTSDEDEEDDDMFRIPGITEDDQKFLERVQASSRTVQNWDNDEELLKKCRALIPWNELATGMRVSGARGRDTEPSPYCNAEKDRLLRASENTLVQGSFAVGGADSNAIFLQRLCRWFQSYMSWVNAPPCSVCGSTDCEMKTVRGPETQEELEGMAKRVEVYYCPVCKANTTTFPRYNKAGKLLETRQGRCGEYANLFGLFCRSAGFETRLVLDWSDHLWTEVRLGDSWVMADACEGVIDQPSMYEHGWGKDGLSYMVGIGRDHVVDVTPRYTRKFMTDDFQTRRRALTESEETSARILQKLNERMRTYPTMLPKTRVDELERRRKLEEAELQQNKQATEWTEQDKYGSGRISGSLEWKKKRQEAGASHNLSSNATTTSTSSTTDNQNSREVAGFPAESFAPSGLNRGEVFFQLHSNPTSRHDGIIVSGTPCAVGVTNSVSVVVVDNSNKALGCILQSKSFVEWDQLADFVETLPTGRIVLMNGKIEIGNETKPEDFYKNVEISRLRNWKGEEVAKKGVLFAGQIDAQPDWAFCETLQAPNNGKQMKDSSRSYQVVIDVSKAGGVAKGMHKDCRLRTERSLFPQRIAGRLPEASMPFARQATATENEKREAYLKFAESHGGRYCGYTTKKDTPVYLLDSTAYPLQQGASVSANISGRDNHTWNTFLELPEPLVSATDYGIDDTPPSGAKALPSYTVPLDSSFFNSSLGSNLLSNTDVRKETSETLTNARLIGLYFSAHWCGPCRSFTPMLAEMYEHLTETYPTHGLEIIFVSSDRDEQSFQNYYRSMPWKAIPFDQLQFVKQALNVTYGVRGIPSFVVLDAVSGEVVVSANESRQEVVTACRGGDLRIEAMFESWLGRTPSSTLELLSMLELSAIEMEASSDNGNDNNRDNNPYLLRTADVSKSDTNHDISILKLVEAGHDHNSAAANSHTSKLSLAVGLNGKMSLVGKSRQTPEDSIERALVYALERNSASTVSGALTVAQKYLRNAKRVPWEPKFRRFRLSNKVADKITQIEGGLGLIQSIGFEVTGTNRDYEASIPLAADLDDVDSKLTKLIGRIRTLK